MTTPEQGKEETLLPNIIDRLKEQVRALFFLLHLNIIIIDYVIVLQAKVNMGHCRITTS